MEVQLGGVYIFAPALGRVTLQHSEDQKEMVIQVWRSPEIPALSTGYRPFAMCQGHTAKAIFPTANRVLLMANYTRQTNVGKGHL